MSTVTIWLHHTYKDLGKLFRMGCIETNRYVRFPSSFTHTSDMKSHLYRRSVFCGCIDYGNYTAKRIMTNDGVPVQPEFDDCKAYLSKNDIELSLFGGVGSIA